jgi:aconitase B
MEDKEQLQATIDRRNKYVRQARGLQARADALYAKIARIDAELAPNG